jgi:hypothetical protein
MQEVSGSIPLSSTKSFPLIEQSQNEVLKAAEGF